ncbi:MAG: RNA 2'-phosphotransferase [Pseudomonadota bacterium]
MTGQRPKQKRLSLSRFLIYLLGHRPDEFGLVPDEQGWVPLKDLLLALSEEPGWSFVRRSHIEELIRDPDGSGFEMTDKEIRAAPEDSTLTLDYHEVAEPPKILYHAARRKAYPVILEQGLTPGGRPFVPLSTTEEMALRIGRRRDADPVLLTIHAQKAHSRGVLFHRPQTLIYLVESLSPEFFTGPPLPKEKPEKKPVPPPGPPTPGSFFLDPERMFEPGGRLDKIRKKKKRDVPDWKRAQRKERRRRDQE